MKMNESIRNAFVHAVLQDTPKAKLDQQERVQKIVQDALYEMAPAKLKSVYDDKKLREYLEHSYLGFDKNPWSSFRFYLVPPKNDRWHNQYAKEYLSKEVMAQVDALFAEHKKIVDERNNLEEKLRATIRGFNTVKQARDAMPEFVKYLPDPEAPTTKGLPAITDLVTDLMKAGWPDGGKKRAAKATA